MAGIVVAAPASHNGKTVVTLGLLRHLARSGANPRPAKTGPDYIDPQFLSAAAAAPCVNLDLFGLGPARVRAEGANLGRGGVAVVEGVMGLFDGAAGEDGSTADLAQALGLPVVLVADAGAQGASAAALVGGFHRHRKGMPLAGVIFNRAGGEKHARILRDAMRAALPDVPVLGVVPRDPALALPERHLGLVQAMEHGRLSAFLDRAAETVARHVDVAALLEIAARASVPAEQMAVGAAAPPLAPPGQRIAIARDVAFAFSYELTLKGWREQGAEISFFSPLADQAPDGNADAVYLPGGYPELHAGRISAAGQFMKGLRERAQAGAAVFGECGGYMVLGEGLTDADGTRHRMAGLLPLETSFAARKLHLGYRRATLLGDAPFGRAGRAFRGHEFHYATIVREEGGESLFETRDAAGGALGRAGLRA
ncbi:MAG: cobyrinate a,c-diamide synthase, partial [Alphaproteobacteria bacterium]|nr:cobyrinate a,c-diamide synthase [Alphaproteobacteria bacterium]